jgi:hypothetical protein
MGHGAEARLLGREPATRACAGCSGVATRMPAWAGRALEALRTHTYMRRHQAALGRRRSTEGGTRQYTRLPWPRERAQGDAHKPARGGVRLCPQTSEKLPSGLPIRLPSLSQTSEKLPSGLPSGVEDAHKAAQGCMWRRKALRSSRSVRMHARAWRLDGRGPRHEAGVLGRGGCSWKRRVLMAARSSAPCYTPAS